MVRGLGRADPAHNLPVVAPAVAPSLPSRPAAQLWDLDLGFGTVFAITWFVATVASAFTLWLLLAFFAG